MFDPQVLAFTGIAALLTLTPGADTMLVLKNVLARGRRAGLLTTLGICSGCLFHATLSSLGLSLILLRSATAYEAVKLLGAGYLMFLGAQALLQTFRHGPVSDQEVRVGAESGRQGGQFRSFGEGFFTNILNPKVAVFYLAFLPQFIRPDEPAFTKSMLLAAIHCGLGIVWLSTFTLFIEGIRGWLNRPQVRRMMEATTGMVLIGFGARLAMERR